MYVNVYTPFFDKNRNPFASAASCGVSCAKRRSINIPNRE